MTVGVILGADFLTQNSIDILLSKHGLQWDGMVIPIQRPLGANWSSTYSRRVTLLEGTPLYTNEREAMVMAEIVDDQGGSVHDLQDCWFELDYELRERVGIITAPAIINGSSGIIPVRILNTGRPVHLFCRIFCESRISFSFPELGHNFSFFLEPGYMRFLVSWNYDNLRKPYKRLVHRLENELNTRLMCWRSVLRGTEGFKCPRQEVCWHQTTHVGCSEKASS